MRLIRIEMHGFKSFKDKVVVRFDEGVTGIVGPNGSGKSNVVDAFLWAMGEKSHKSLRTDKSEDLLFEGSAKYAASSMAEVTIVLDTGADAAEAAADGVSPRDLPPHLRYKEISVTRRLFRDGSSEFLMNGATCRLKDIEEIFMDTGSGPKAYSIIEQGQVKRIVESRPEDRRVLIEEAAGIVKFKARKKESQRKIEATRLNIDRLNDIIAEIERQMKYLEREAAKARQYKKCKDELQGKELLLGRKRLHDLGLKSAQAGSALEACAMADVQSRNAMATAELRIENLSLQVAEAQRLAEDAQAALQALEREISREEADAQVRRGRLGELERSNVTLDQENQTLASAVERLGQDQARIRQEAAELEEMFQGADAKLRESQARFDEAKARADELARALEEEKRDLMSAVSRRSEISSQVNRLEERVDGLSVQIAGLDGRIGENEPRCEALIEAATVLKTAFETASAEARAAREREGALRVETAELDAELARLRADEAAAREERAKTESGVKALQKLVENYEGFRSDVRAILGDASLASRARGAFADRVEAHPGYEYALEAVLHEFLENVFVEDAAAGRVFIQALKDRGVGRATLWPLDLLETRAAARAASGAGVIDVSTVLAMAPSARPLRDVLRLSHEGANAVLALFDHHFVVETLDDALEGFRKAAGLGASFVTKEGDVVDRYGRVTGGSQRSLEGGILARKSELQKLTSHLAAATARAEELGDRLAQVDAALKDRRGELEAVSGRLREVDVAAKTAERDLASAQSELARVAGELERSRGERDRLEAERKGIWETLDGMRQERTGLEDSAQQREAAIQTRTSEQESAARAAAELQGELVSLKVGFATAREKAGHASQNLARIEAELTQRSERKEDVQRLMNRGLDERDLVASEIKGIEARLAELASRAQRLQDAARERKDEVERITAQQREAFEEQRSAMKGIEEAGRRLGELKVEQERAKIEHESLFRSLFEKYGIEESAIAPQGEEERKAFGEITPERESELSAEVDRLRSRFQKLEGVNLSAVEEYDEQKKRHEFLVTQRTDLQKSIEDLERAIKRIDKTSEERFKVAFEEINARFQRIFPVCFGGGSGRLILTIPGDLNETGVDIEAVPPGKKINSPQQLSGGEKALTAIALIFSIFLIKPSPFCVLDEVDAPLDAHNVGKFNALLKEMSVKSQFIVITHKTETMERTDNLYGVTMEEPGVSKLVSIQMQ